MGLLEEAAAAIAALEVTKKLDPNASILTEGIAMVAGYEGAKTLTEHAHEKDAASSEAPPAPTV